MRVNIYPAIFILFLVFFTGCAASFQQHWLDFTAYYNTFYNANQYYNEGLTQNLQQRPGINPEVPIRIHFPPSNAGRQEFEGAIEKSADILRRHNQSSYVDQAIEMIGKSNYYRGEFFAALKKFQELFNTTSDVRLKQRALIWEGRTYLEMEIHDEGSRLLEDHLESSMKWEPELRAEARAILAQHYVKQEEWEKAADVLQTALDDLEDREKKARGYFLYGQLLERTNDFQASYTAFRNVMNHRPYYELEFYALYKEADIFRQMGFYHNAYDLFRSMERDDKHFSRRPELLFELAKTEQLRGNPEEAKSIYKRVLRYRATHPRPSVLAKSYYGMAEIHREFYRDFEMAAAYYDSAGMQRVDERNLPSGWNAEELAKAFSEYVDVSGQIARMDSLLRLASMEPAELDSALARIREQHQRELARQQEIRDEFTGIEEISEELTTEGSEGLYGFLNIRNQGMLERASLQFQARWGLRPLADNWRRAEAVSGSRREFENQQIVVEAQEVAPKAIETESAGIDPGIEMASIPLTRTEQDSMRSERVKKYYQLGNIFLLNLELPDSARVYFNRVISEDEIDVSGLKPRALYALSEISRLEGNQEEADRWIDSLLQKYPDSTISLRIAGRRGTSMQESDISNQKRTYLAEVSQKGQTSAFERARNLHRLALEFSKTEPVPNLFYEIAQEYIKAGREETGSEMDSEQKMKIWQNVQKSWEEERAEFFAMQETANSKLTDPDLSEGERIYWEKMADSTLPKPNFFRVYPYRGAEWDRARTVLRQLDSLYPNSQVNKRAEYLRQELQLPEVPEDNLRSGLREPETSLGSEGSLPDTGDEGVSCLESGSLIKIRGGLSAFLDRVEFPEWTREIPFRNEIEYSLVISPGGEVLDSQIHRPSDRQLRGSGIPEALEDAFRNHLRFESAESRKSAGTVECTIRFSY